MSEHNGFTEVQKNYLQGLAMGADVARAVRSLPVLAGTAAARSTVLRLGPEVAAPGVREAQPAAGPRPSPRQLVARVAPRTGCVAGLAPVDLRFEARSIRHDEDRGAGHEGHREEQGESERDPGIIGSPLPAARRAPRATLRVTALASIGAFYRSSIAL